MATSFLKECEISLRRLVMRLLQAAIRHRSASFDGIVPRRAKFLFIRQDMLGDVLVSTPLFRSLQEKYPDATLDAVLSPKNHFAIDENPNISHKWIYDKSLGGTWQLIKQLRLERYDFAVDLMDNPSATSTILCLLSGSRWNVGIEKDNAYIYDIRVPMLSRKDFHISVRLGELLRPFGIDPANVDYRPDYHVAHGSREFAEGMLERLNPLKKPLLGVNISAGTDVRFWGIGNFRDMLTGFRKTYPDWCVVILFKPADMGRALAIAATDKSIQISDPTPTFDHFAAILQRCNVLVTPDTSAVHLASAFRIPSVVMYVQSDPELRIWDPYNTPCRTLVTPTDDLSTIQPSEVFGALCSLMAELSVNGKGK